MAREIVIDLANYQANLSVQDYKKIGAKYAIVKTSENTNYVNECAKALVNRSALGGVKGFAFIILEDFTMMEMQ